MQVTTRVSSLTRLGFGLTRNLPPFSQQLQNHARGISHTTAHQGRWEMAIKKKSHWLDTSRNLAKEEANCEDKVVLSADGRVVVAWHPEVPFPYEQSKPLPLDITPTDSNLKVQALMPVRESIRPKHHRLIVRELMELTYTSKHRWFCRPTRLNRYKKMDPMGVHEKRDREGI